MKPIVIGITGSIASGKSSFTEALSGLGVQTLSSDKIVFDICQKNKSGYNALKDLKIPDLIDKDKELNKTLLRDLVFNNEDIRRKVEEKLHPLVIDEFKRKISSLKDKEILAVEIPLLFEAKIENLCDHTVVVYRDLSNVINSIVDRYKTIKIQAEKILNTQLSAGEKILRSNIVILNNGDIKSLKLKASSLLEYISIT
jgi:dephospho-CoA kinase